jgi:hypothetical protein
VQGLAALGVYLVSTNHLSDRRLLTVLCTSILREKVRDVPPSDEMSEYVDLTAVPPAERKGRRKLSGPYKAASDRDATLPRPDRSKLHEKGTAIKECA